MAVIIGGNPGNGGPDLSDEDPAPLGSADPGLSDDASRADHMHGLPTPLEIGAATEEALDAEADARELADIALTDALTAEALARQAGDDDLAEALDDLPPSDPAGSAAAVQSSLAGYAATTDAALANKVDKTTAASRIYGTDGSGEQTAYVLNANNPTANTIVQRDPTGKVLGEDPTTGRHLVNHRWAEARYIVSPGTTTFGRARLADADAAAARAALGVVRAEPLYRPGLYAVGSGVGDGTYDRRVGWVVPKWFRAPASVTGIALTGYGSTSAGAGAMWRFALYTMNAYGEPANLIVDAGTVPALVGAWAEATIAPHVFGAGEGVCVAVALQGATADPTIRVIPYAARSDLDIGKPGASVSRANSEIVTGYRLNGADVVPGAFPAVIPPFSAGSASPGGWQPPQIWLRLT